MPRNYVSRSILGDSSLATVECYGIVNNPHQLFDKFCFANETLI